MKKIITKGERDEQGQDGVQEPEHLIPCHAAGNAIINVDGRQLNTNENYRYMTIKKYFRH